jgi:hypothetical protein
MSTRIPRMRYRSSRLCLTVLVCAVVLRDGSAVLGATPLSIADIKTRLTAVNAMLRAWCIEYQASSDDLDFYNHRLLAARAPNGCFYRGAKGTARHDVKDGTIFSDWQNDPFGDWVLVAPKRCLSGVAFNREYTEFEWREDSELPAKVQRELLITVLGWWPFASRPGPRVLGGGVCVIPDIVACPDYIVREDLEACEGRMCHVVERAGYDRIWIDCDRNCTILARELCDLYNGAVMQRLEMRDHREDLPGVWVPRQVRNLHFDYTASSAQQRERQVLDASIQIVDVKLNEAVTESLFTPPTDVPGCVRVEQDTYRQVVPGGHDCIEHQAEWLSRVTGTSQDAADTATTVEYVVIVGCAIVLAWLYRPTRRAED